MSWGSTQNTQGSNQSTQSGGSSNTTTPNLPPWLQSAFQGFVGQGQNLSATAAQPVYGQAQTASYLQGLNNLANQSTASLASSLASKGVENSGALSQGATDIQTARLGNAASFMGNLPFMNQQATLQNEEGALNAGLGAAKAVPYGSTSTGTSSGQQAGTSQSSTQQNPGIAGLISSLGGMALGGLTGGIGAPTAGGKGTSLVPSAGGSEDINPGYNMSGFTQQPAPYAANPSTASGSTWGQNPFNPGAFNPFGSQ